jgi:S1-C subfamily serine protease
MTFHMRIAWLFVAFLICVGQAFADCPNCVDGLVGSGPVKWVCPICDGVPQPVVKAEKPDHRKSVVRIRSQHGDYASSGSGVVIDHEGTPAILTARHVVFEDGKPGVVTVYFQDGSESAAVIVKHDDPFDLALLACDTYAAAAVPLAASPKMGDTITVAGFGPAPHEFRVSSGRMVGRSKPVGRHPADFIDISTTARQGDSGGPFFNEAGEVAGIVWGSTNMRAIGSHSGRLRAFLGNGPKDLDNLSSACQDGRCRK